MTFPEFEKHPPADGITTIASDGTQNIDSPWDIADCFQGLRNMPEFHLGMGDIRLTRAMQDDICWLVEQHYSKTTTMNKTANSLPNSGTLPESPFNRVENNIALGGRPSEKRDNLLPEPELPQLVRLSDDVRMKITDLEATLAGFEGVFYRFGIHLENCESSPVELSENNFLEVYHKQSVRLGDLRDRFSYMLRLLNEVI